MAIVFSCKCGHALRAKEDAAGKRSKCPHCGTFFTIPVAVTATAGAQLGLETETASPLFDWSPPELGLQSGLSGSTDSLATSYALDGDAPSSSETPVQPSVMADPGAQRYKVYVQSGKGFSGKLDQGKLEVHLNSMAAQGWAIRTAVTLRVSDNGGAHDELVFILER